MVRLDDDEMSKIDALVHSDWDEIGLFHLSAHQTDALLHHHGVTVERGWFPARYAFGEHAHGRPQLLLVTRSRLTHSDGKMSYTQGENDLLIVPAKLKHTAIVGSEELEFYLILKR